LVTIGAGKEKEMVPNVQLSASWGLRCLKTHINLFNFGNSQNFGGLKTAKDAIPLYFPANEG
jgi:hypothetical protein